MERRFGFPKEFRLRKLDEFRRVYAARCSLANSLLIGYILPNGRDYSRLGLSVSRKIGNAVIRNYWKRRLREIFRLTRHKLPQGFDIVVLPKANVNPPDFSRLKNAFLNLVFRLGKKGKK